MIFSSSRRYWQIRLIGVNAVMELKQLTLPMEAVCRVEKNHTKEKITSRIYRVGPKGNCGLFQQTISAGSRCFAGGRRRRAGILPGSFARRMQLFFVVHEIVTKFGRSDHEMKSIRSSAPVAELFHNRADTPRAIVWTGHIKRLTVFAKHEFLRTDI